MEGSGQPLLSQGERLIETEVAGLLVGVFQALAANKICLLLIHS